jgi:hypothetical protein
LQQSGSDLTGHEKATGAVEEHAARLIRRSLLRFNGCGLCCSNDILIAIELLDHGIPAPTSLVKEPPLDYISYGRVVTKACKS